MPKSEERRTLLPSVGALPIHIEGSRWDYEIGSDGTPTLARKAMKARWVERENYIRSMAGAAYRP